MVVKVSHLNLLSLWPDFGSISNSPFFREFILLLVNRNFGIFDTLCNFLVLPLPEEKTGWKEVSSHLLQPMHVLVLSHSLIYLHLFVSAKKSVKQKRKGEKRNKEKQDLNVGYFPHFLSSVLVLQITSLRTPRSRSLNFTGFYVNLKCLHGVARCKRNQMWCFKTNNF